MLKQAETASSCLFIVNTKKWASELYQYCQEHNVPKETLFHLSTNQCAAHRRTLLAWMKRRLKRGLPVICISTQLIEAGVDISMACVIRALAGLDSIAQAAGRCNRHGEQKGRGRVWVLNLQNESLQMLPDINKGQELAGRVFRELHGQDILQPAAMQRYFQYYFYHRSNDMAYQVKNNATHSLLDWLSDNNLNPYAAKNDRRRQNKQYPLLMQSFKSAGQVFQAIDAPTHAVIVPYGRKGRDLIKRLCGEYDPKSFYLYLSQAQRFSVNVFPQTWVNLEKKQAIYQIADTGVYYLKESFYTGEYGLCLEKNGLMDFHYL